MFEPDSGLDRRAFAAEVDSDVLSLWVEFDRMDANSGDSVKAVSNVVELTVE